MEKERGDGEHWVSESEFDGGLSTRLWPDFSLAWRNYPTSENGVMKTPAIDVPQQTTVLKAE